MPSEAGTGEKLREQFEKWWKSVKSRPSLTWPHAKIAWEAWQAASEITPPKESYAEYVNGQRDTFRLYGQLLREIPIQNARLVTSGWNRYDTDNEHVLHVWSEGESFDVRVPKDEFLPKVKTGKFIIEEVAEASEITQAPPERTELVIVGMGDSLLRVQDHKWVDPECHEKGCQSLVLKHASQTEKERWARQIAAKQHYAGCLLTEGELLSILNSTETK